MPETKLKKLGEMMKLINEGVSRDEVFGAFKEILKIVKGIKTSNEQEWTLIHSAMQMIPDKMMSEMYAEMSKTEKKMVKDCMDMCDKMCATMDKKHTDEMAKMKLEVGMIKGDREMIIEDTLAKVPQQIIETPEQIRDKLKSLPEEESLTIESIKDLRKELDEVRKQAFLPRSVGVMSAKEFITDIDISSQLDGVTKTFNIQNVWKIISIDLSSYPFGAMQKTTDFTWTPTSITFTDAIDAGTQLSAGQKCIITAII